MSHNNYYQELNITPDATDQEVKLAYRKLAFEFHPDRNKENSNAAEKMKSINEAYAVLSDTEKRREYDRFYQQYGSGAKQHFRQHFSEQDIFQGSDIEQIFEEMARSFGLRGFDDLFKDFHVGNHQTYRFEQNGIFGKSFSFETRGRVNRYGKGGHGLLGTIFQNLINKVTGMLIPQRGADLHDVIVLNSEFASQGGPYAYFHEPRDKKLVVQIPKGVNDGQLIRLTAMGKDGTHGAGPGDLLLRVKIRRSLLDKIKTFIGLNR